MRMCVHQSGQQRGLLALWPWPPGWYWRRKKENEEERLRRPEWKRKKMNVPDYSPERSSPSVVAVATAVAAVVVVAGSFPPAAIPIRRCPSRRPVAGSLALTNRRLPLRRPREWPTTIHRPHLPRWRSLVAAGAGPWRAARPRCHWTPPRRMPPGRVLTSRWSSCPPTIPLRCWCWSPSGSRHTECSIPPSLAGRRSRTGRAPEKYTMIIILACGMMTSTAVTFMVPAPLSVSAGGKS